MAEDTAIVHDLARSSAFDTLKLIVARAQLVDDAGSQLAIITAAVAMLAGTVKAAILDQDTDAGIAGTGTLWDAVFDAAHARPMMTAVITAKAAA